MERANQITTPHSWAVPEGSFFPLQNPAGLVWMKQFLERAICVATPGNPSNGLLFYGPYGPEAFPEYASLSFKLKGERISYWNKGGTRDEDVATMAVVTSILKQVGSGGQEETAVTYRLFRQTPHSSTVEQKQDQTTYMMKLENFAQRMTGYAKLHRNTFKPSVYSGGHNACTYTKELLFMDEQRVIQRLMLPHLQGGKLPVTALRKVGQKYFDEAKAATPEEWTPAQRSRYAFDSLMRLNQSFNDSTVSGLISSAWSFNHVDGDTEPGIGDDSNRWQR